MQKDPLISALLGALFLGSVATLALGIGYQMQSSKARGLQAQLVGIQKTRMVVEALVSDSVQYGRTHPAINPLLVRVGVPVPPMAK